MSRHVSFASKHGLLGVAVALGVVVTVLVVRSPGPSSVPTPVRGPSEAPRPVAPPAVTVEATPLEWIKGPGGTLLKTKVTVAQYQACVGVGKCTEPDTGTKCNWAVKGRARHPVNCVDWQQAKTFCAWAGGRLPKGKEWFAAATNGGTTRFPWGDEPLTFTRAHFGQEPETGSTAEVGTYPAGASDAGLQDLLGNAAEWVEDDRPMKYDEGITATLKETRGCSWRSLGDCFALPYDGAEEPWVRMYDYGFRCAR